MAHKRFFIHKTSCIDEHVRIGAGTKIWHFCHVLKGSSIGDRCTIGQNCMIGPDVTIGNRCKLQNNISIYTAVTLEDDVFCGPSCVFTNVYNPRAFIERKHEFRPTIVKRGATIGANATIVCGATIGEYALVAAGAVVRKDVPDYAIIAGVPARQVGWACKCGTTLRLRVADYRLPSANSRGVEECEQAKRALCVCCGNEYLLQHDRLTMVEKTDDYGSGETIGIIE